ncbi:hypothetical protein [Streptomyces sp. NPDC102370]|uniref:hypothetical protein n=1 Tax=Streptomyces sp. NPDC102370 TaxID=3366163 RepID=UPI0037F2AF33
MASIRTARVIAAVSALPLAAALFAGVATADNGALDTGVGGDNFGNSATTQQQATGWGAENESNTAQVNGSAFTNVNQGEDNVAISFAPFWWPAI